MEKIYNNYDIVFNCDNYYNGNDVSLHSRYIRGYSLPSNTLNDASSSSISDTSLTMADGVTTMEFTRSRKAKDPSRGVTFTDTEGFYFIYPENPGDLQTWKHASTPFLSSEKIIVADCEGMNEITNDC